MAGSRSREQLPGPIYLAIDLFCGLGGWTVQRSGFGVLVPFEVSHDAVRSVVDHWRSEHA